MTLLTDVWDILLIGDPICPMHWPLLNVMCFINVISYHQI